MSQPVVLSVASSTDVGRCRRINEDAVLASAPVFVVADGMGGHDAGDRASAIAIQELGRLEAGCAVEDVRDALALARAEIDRLNAHHARRAAGTTVSGLVLVEQAGEPYWLVLNLGDSRTYHVVAGHACQVSVDHSEVQELLDQGKLDPVAAEAYARRHVITRALGAHTAARPDYWLMPVRAGERWLVCSDGLTGELDDRKIADVLIREESAQAAVDQLMGQALEGGGRDNVSVVVVDVIEAGVEIDEPTVEEILMINRAPAGAESDGPRLEETLVIPRRGDSPRSPASPAARP